MLGFSAWAKAQQVDREALKALEATDFSDYYKLVMSRVQYLYAIAQPGQDEGLPLFPQCTFQTQVRDDMACCGGRCTCFRKELMFRLPITS